jgi:hypothetical protein
MTFATRQPHGLTVHLKPIRQWGFSACQTGDLRNPHMAESVAGLAWDRGMEAAMIYKKATAG